MFLQKKTNKMALESKKGEKQMANSSRQRLSINLGRLRERKRLSIEASAVDCEISVRHFGDIERGQCNTTLDTLDKISKGMNVSVPELLSESHTCKYQIVKSVVKIEGKMHTVYGITNGEETIFDVSTKIDVVKKLVDVLNQNNVSDVHFRDIVEDLLGSL